MSFIALVGLIFLSFRLWLVEYRVKPHLGDETTYFSRIICYYLAIAMVFDFNLISINAIITTSLPSFTIITLLTDFRMFIKMKKLYPGHSRNDYIWIFIERLTLHFPILAAGVYMFMEGFDTYVNLSRGVLPLIAAGMMFYIPFLFRDVRWRFKKEWPLGFIIFLFSVGQVLAIFIIFR